MNSSGCYFLIISFKTSSMGMISQILNIEENNIIDQPHSCDVPNCGPPSRKISFDPSLPLPRFYQQLRNATTNHDGTLKVNKLSGLYRHLAAYN
jgi:hypothetical protein